MSRAGGKRAATLVLAGLALGACQQIEKANPFGNRIVAPACPDVRLLADADRVTVYRPGPGRDLTDIMYEASLQGFTGECEYGARKEDRFTEVKIRLNLDYEVVLGPATPDRTAEIRYFVALPEFFPLPEGRSEFSQRVKFPGTAQAARFKDRDINLTIPLPDGKRGPEMRVLIGFVLTPEQLEQNRQLKGPQLSN